MWLRPRQPLFEAGVCAALGITLGDLAFESIPWLWQGALALAVVFFLFARKGRWWLWLGLVAFFCFWQAWRTHEDPARWLATQIPQNGRVLEALAVVDEDPPSRGRVRVRLREAVLDGVSHASAARMLITWPHEERPKYGDLLEITGTARNLTAPRNPGEFDSPSIRRRQGIYSELTVRYANAAKVVGHDEGNPLIAASLRLRHWMEATLTRDLEDSPAVCSVISSVVLGAKAESLRDIERLFAHTGTLHLFAVSGMNVAMIAVSAAWFLAVCRMPLRVIALTIIPLLWVYCFVTGLTASSLRATIMATLTLGGVALDRPALSWNTLGASALLILLWRPEQLFTPGFQLSFLLVAALLAGVEPMRTLFHRWGQPDPYLPQRLWTPWQRSLAGVTRAGSGALAVSLVAWLGSMPLTVYYFHLWSPSTVPANLAAGALAWAMLMLGLASAWVGSFWTWLSITLNNANWLFSQGLLLSTSFLAGLPGSHFYVDSPSLREPPKVEINVLDLAGGGAIHLRLREGEGRWATRRDWLIDCGSVFAYEWRVSPYLQSRGVNQLDGLIVTHGDSQHLGGALPLMERLPVMEVIDAPYKDRSPLRRRLHSELAARGKGKRIVSAGEQLTLAPGVRLDVLHPPLGRKLRTADDKALVFRLEVERGKGEAPLRLLFMSDAGFTTEKLLLSTLPPEALRADLLIKGRHAGDLSGTPEFLAAVAPEVVVTSGAEFPPEQRVDEAWAAALKAEGIILLRQDHTGAVRITVAHSGQWEATPFLSGH